MIFLRTDNWPYPDYHPVSKGLALPCIPQPSQQGIVPSDTGHLWWVVAEQLNEGMALPVVSLGLSSAKHRHSHSVTIRASSYGYSRMIFTQRTCDLLRSIIYSWPTETNQWHQYFWEDFCLQSGTTQTVSGWGSVRKHLWVEPRCWLILLLVGENCDGRRESQQDNLE